MAKMECAAAASAHSYCTKYKYFHIVLLFILGFDQEN